MSVTTEAKTRPATKRANKTAEAATTGGGRPGLRRRRSCGVGRCWWWHRSRRCASAGCLACGPTRPITTAQEVVAVRSTVQRGALISREDLVTVRIGVDPALNPVPAAQLEAWWVSGPPMDLPAGGLVTQGSIAATVVPAQDMSVVGVAVPAALLPGEPLRAGDQVRVVATPGQQGEVTDGEQRSITAIVVGVYPEADSGQTVVSVQVPYDQAAELAARAGDRQGRRGAGFSGALTDGGDRARARPPGRRG